MKRNHFLQLIIILAVLFCVTAAKAEPIPEAEAQAWADEKGRLLLTTFREPDLALRYETLDKLFLEHIDLEYISKFIMGKYWKTMTPDQRQTYRELFRRYALGIYKTFPLDFASSLTYKVTGASVRGDFTTVQAVVHVTLDDKLEPQDINLYFRLHKQNGKIKLVDITMEQSSLILAYRNRFYEMIAAGDGDMEWFLEDLENLAVSAEENNRLRLEKSPF